MLKLTLAALAGLVAAVLAAGAASALAQEASEVRISARRLADGRVEFALQHRAGRGWGERALPASRYFPANAAVGRWLNSSPVSGDARISARRLADGRIEFALQQQNAVGGWGERVLPSSRYFPRTAAAGRWLNSSPVRIARGLPPPGATCFSLADHSDRVLAATFQVRTSSSSGTAFYIGSGEWLTNHHVVDDVSRVALVRDGVRLNAAVAGSLPGYDLALLRAQPPASVLPLRLAASRTAVAARVAVAGFPRGVSDTPSLTRGLVSEYAPFAEWKDRVHWVRLADSGFLLRTDALINPGSSGSPIVDDCGAVAAIATFHTDREDQFVLASGIAAETIAANLASLGSIQAPAPPLRVTAFCTFEWGETQPSESECRDKPVNRELSDWYVYPNDGRGPTYTQSAGGLQTAEGGARPLIVFSYRFNGKEEFRGSKLRSHLNALPAGCHELAISAQRFVRGVPDARLPAGGGDGVWSEPYPFCVEAITLRVTAFCTVNAYEVALTKEECRERSVDRALPSWDIRSVGVIDWGDVTYRFNGEDAIRYGEVRERLWALPPGCHEIAIAEAGVWSEPYPFCVEAITPRITPRRVVAFCTFSPPRPSFWICSSLPVNRDLPYWDVWIGEALTKWGLGTEEVVDGLAVLFRFNGEDGFPRSRMWERIFALPSGWNEIAIANESSPGVWSEPYRFYVE